MFKDTVPSLEALYRSCRLYLLTAGDKRVQRDKLRGAGLSGLFQKIWIVPDKTPEVFRDLLKAEQLRPEDCWMVGNSVRSDVKPALANGVKALHQDREVWQYDLIETELSDALYRKVRNLTTAAGIILGSRQLHGVDTSKSKSTLKLHRSVTGHPRQLSRGGR